MKNFAVWLYTGGTMYRGTITADNYYQACNKLRVWTMPPAYIWDISPIEDNQKGN